MRYTVSHSRGPDDSSDDTINHGNVRPVLSFEPLVSDGLEGMGMGMGKVPAAGEVTPDFELPDSTGVLRRLSELLSQGSVVLLFYRGHW